jgi:hypothetical protein
MAFVTEFKRSRETHVTETTAETCSPEMVCSTNNLKMYIFEIKGIAASTAQMPYFRNLCYEYFHIPNKIVALFVQESITFEQYRLK